uniref:class I SAM-dependent methyltransferase n=1 Tax=Paractinoplanes polyasparticus TaxID=2856853 RepID=UPI001C865C77|nr:class I SAM-dependent methyltransferase [Actinoplanes polyasparticus]
MPPYRHLSNLVRRRAITFRNAVRAAHDDGGRPAAVREAAQLFGELVARPVRRQRERRLDRAFNLDTAGLSVDATTTAATFDDAVAYSPIPIHHFRTLMRQLPVTAPSDFAFVDLGCGKGRTLILAAEHGFRPVVGVELDARLSAVGRSNAFAYAAASNHSEPVIAVVTTDAVDYTLPPSPTVVFLFNPFGPDTLSAVLANLERSIKEHPRRLIVAYFNPVHEQVLADSPALRRTSNARHWSIYESAS